MGTRVWWDSDTHRVTCLPCHMRAEAPAAMLTPTRPVAIESDDIAAMDEYERRLAASAPYSEPAVCQDAAGNPTANCPDAHAPALEEHWLGDYLD